jgi:acyl-coenzyme A thioesterase PaaI-like protein
MDGEITPRAGLDDHGRNASEDELVAVMRQVQDLIVDRDAPEEVLRASADALRGVAAELRRAPVDDKTAAGDQWAGRSHAPGLLIPAFEIDRLDEAALTGRVIFSPFFHGGGGAVHGGAIPLLFDHIIGQLTNTGRSRTRTAYLNVNYRQITPIGSELSIDASVDREEGRKLFATARLRKGEDLLADSEALYITLRPDQP